MCCSKPMGDAIPSSPTGFVYYGPDGRWHWSPTYDTHESVEDQRPATITEAALATSYLEKIAEIKGNST